VASHCGGNLLLARQWKHSFGSRLNCTETRLRNAVLAVGPLVADGQRYSGRLRNPGDGAATKIQRTCWLISLIGELKTCLFTSFSPAP
jgi:hypothetical protein